MSILSGVSDFFGLDLGTTGVRAVQLKGTGPVKVLDRYGHAPMEGVVGQSDAQIDKQKVAQTIQNLIKQTGLSTKNVAVNLPSSRVFTAMTDWDKMPSDELAKTIRYQAESIIPTPLAESKLDWSIIGDAPGNTNKVEVLLSSVANDFVEGRLSMLEQLGLNVIAFEPDSMALARAILPKDVLAPQMALDVGATSTDLVITLAGAPRLVRSISVGSQAIIRAAIQNLNIEASQAEQFVFKFGLGKDKLEGQVYNAIIGTVDNLMSEVDKSIKFFQSRYPSTKLERIVVTGGASAMPEFPLYVANKFGINVEIGNAWRNVSFPASRQDELLAVSNHFGVAAGLAERVE
jgi:type IV pilus assembly protein PilM